MAGSRNRSRAHVALAPFALALACLALAASPAAGMRSKVITPHLCKTVNGGRFVPIPGFPGEKIDRRLLPDIKWMKHRFHIFITDGYSTDPVHDQNGEHPIGLATDIVPNTAKGGTWGDIGDLAHLAEPTQNEPIMPWRWVGWNGDPGHGRGDHVHLSWSHSPTEPKHPARVVYTRKCPDSSTPPPDGGGGGHHRHRHGSNGGTGAGSGGGGDGSSNGGTGAGSGGGGGASSNGGISLGKVGRLAPAVPDEY